MKAPDLQLGFANCAGVCLCPSALLSEEEKRTGLVVWPLPFGAWPSLHSSPVSAKHQAQCEDASVKEKEHWCVELGLASAASS